MKGRLRIHIIQNRMTYAEADTLSWYLEEQENVTEVKVYERTADAVICYKGEREEILTVLKQFSYEKAEVPETDFIKFRQAVERRVQGTSDYEDSIALWK